MKPEIKLLEPISGAERRETLAGWIEEAKKKGEKLDLSFAFLDNTDLSGLDLSGADLTGANLAFSLAVGTKFVDCVCTGMYAANADFYQADFTNARCVVAVFEGAAFPEAILQNADFRYATIDGLHGTPDTEKLLGCKTSTVFNEEFTHWEYTPNGWEKLEEGE